MNKERTKSGISLRKTYKVIYAISLFIAVVLLFTMYRTFKAYYSLSAATDKYIELQDTANRLLQASDYLTEEAQCYSVNGDRRHLENYFEEVTVHRNREKAIDEMEAQIPDSEAVDKLNSAMRESISLMDREYHAMRLVLSAKHDTNIPELLKDTPLSPEEVRMSTADKMLLAQELMHNDAYYDQKEVIYTNMEECIKSLKNDSLVIQKKYERQLFFELLGVTSFIFAQSVFLIFILRFTTTVGLKPLIESVEHIKNNEEIPLSGADEFKYVAVAYNRMRAIHKHNFEEMTYKALHDEMTGLYDRAGFDVIAPTLNPATTAFLLIDTDNFKEINDTFGHDIGDRILCKIADTLSRYFRPGDYIFRIGGDEFAVLMTNVGITVKDNIAEKIEEINKALADDKDGLPRISISVGIDINYNATNFDQMYKHADEALYKVKDNGRNGYGFFAE